MATVSPLFPAPPTLPISPSKTPDACAQTEQPARSSLEPGPEVSQKSPQHDAAGENVEVDLLNQLTGDNTWHQVSDTLFGAAFALITLNREHIHHVFECGAGISRHSKVDYFWRPLVALASLLCCVLMAVVIQISTLVSIWNELPPLSNDPGLCRWGNIKNGYNYENLEENANTTNSIPQFALMLFIINSFYSFHDLICNFRILLISFKSDTMTFVVAPLDSNRKGQFEIRKSIFASCGRLVQHFGQIILTCGQLGVYLGYLIVGCRYMLQRNSIADMIQAAVGLVLINSVDKAIYETMVPGFMKAGIKSVFFARQNEQWNVKTGGEGSEGAYVFEYYFRLFLPLKDCRAVRDCERWAKILWPAELRVSFFADTFVYIGLALLSAMSGIIISSMTENYCDT